MSNPPSELIIGRNEGAWPVLAFNTPGHAMAWLRANRRGSVWRVNVSDPVELVLEEPAIRLVPKEEQ